MARIFTEGFEMGDLLAFTGTIGEDDYFGVRTTSKRSGDYGLLFSGGSLWKDITEVNEIYVRIAYCFNQAYSDCKISVRNSADNAVMMYAYIDFNQPIKLYVGDTLVATGTTVLSISAAWYLIEIHFYLDNTNGKIECKLNGIPECSYTGDTNPGAYSEFDRVYFVSAGGINTVGFLDDIAINDTTGTEDNSWCGDGHIIAIKPNADGDSSQLTNSAGTSVSNYTYVDDIPLDGDTTYVWGNTLNNQDLYNLEAPSLPVNHKIKRVYAEARAKDPDTGNIALPIKSGTTQDDGTTKGLTTAYSAIKGDEYLLNPDDSAAWEEADLNALQAGVKIKS